MTQDSIGYTFFILILNTLSRRGTSWGARGAAPRLPSSGNNAIVQGKRS